MLADGALEARTSCTDGFTAFLWPCYHGDAAVAEALQTLGCNAAAVTSKGMTALMLAVANGYAVLVPRLLATGTLSSRRATKTA